MSKIITPLQIESLSKAYFQILLDNNYHNASKLSVIFDFWLFQFMIAINNYSDIPSDCLDLYTHFCNKDNFVASSSATVSNNLLKNIFWKFLSFIPLSRGVFAGGIFRPHDSLVSTVTCYKLHFASIQIDQKLKELFLSLAQVYLSPYLFSQFVKVLPCIFFHSIILFCEFILAKAI